jgi:hypothetical protein
MGRRGTTAENNADVRVGMTSSSRAAGTGPIRCRPWMRRSSERYQFKGRVRSALLIAALTCTLTLPDADPSLAHVDPGVHAWCSWGSNPAMSINTPAQVPFLRMGGRRRQRRPQTVWFRVHFYEQRGMESPVYLDSSDWYSHPLRRGQVTTTSWYQASTGQRSTWTLHMNYAYDGAKVHFLTYELEWHRRGSELHRDVIRPWHDNSWAGDSCYAGLAF